MIFEKENDGRNTSTERIYLQGYGVQYRPIKHTTKGILQESLMNIFS